jgi:protein-disulfide isomerase
MFVLMKAILVAAVLLAACRPSDGGSQGTAARGGTSSAAGDSAAANALLVRADEGRIQGDSAAKVWVVELSDFQCPYCKRWHDETYEALRREFVVPGIIRLAYVNLPLTSLHANALPAAEAAMCASVQNRFWQMHDALFKTQERWANLPDASAVFDSLAVSVGVNQQQYRDCLKSGVITRIIRADMGRAANAGIQSTPVFFVGSEPISGAAPIQAFRAAIARARAAAVTRPPR